MAEQNTSRTNFDVTARNAAVERAEAEALETALAAEVTITLEKKAGSDTFRRNIRASSASAAVSALAVLVREYAVMMDMTAAEVLAVLATVLTAPALQAEQKEEPAWNRG